MAAIAGAETWAASAAVVTPITLGATLLTLPLPAGTVVAGLDLDVSQLDTDAAPTIALDIGDASDADRFVAADETAQAGGALEYRPENTAWYRYNAATSLLVAVQTAPATGAIGAVAVTLYGYPGVDISRLVRSTLQGIGVLAEGETARAEDAALALEALAEVHEMLRGKRLTTKQGGLTWPLALVPVFASRPYAALAGDLLADTFGLSAARAQRLASRAQMAEREIRKQTYTPTSGEPVSLAPYNDEGEFVADYGQLA